MTPGDVMDQIIGDDRITHFRDVDWGEQDQCGDVIQMWDALLSYVRPDGPHHLPLSPVELTRLRVGLRTIVDGIENAHAIKPAHFYLVEEGGR